MPSGERRQERILRELGDVRLARPRPASHAVLWVSLLALVLFVAWAAWAEIDTESLEMLFHRVEYPVEAAADAIHAAGLPAHLAERLAQGR